jgi:hypothetical protein
LYLLHTELTRIWQAVLKFRPLRMVQLSGSDFHQLTHLPPPQILWQFDFETFSLGASFSQFWREE